MMQVRFEGEFDFPLLEDRDHKVINRYGIFNPDGRGWPHPATYIIDPQAVVRWQFIEVDYKKRASNEQIRRELAKIKYIVEHVHPSQPCKTLQTPPFPP